MASLMPWHGAMPPSKKTVQHSCERRSGEGILQRMTVLPHTRTSVVLVTSSWTMCLADNLNIFTNLLVIYRVTMVV